MSQYLRPRIPGATVFFTVCLADRQATVLTDHIEDLRLAVAQTRRERPFVIDAFVVLPDHLHAIWTLPEGDADYSVRWGAIKARFTRASARKQDKGDCGIWQRRFWDHPVGSDREYAALLHHCWWDPVRHGHTTHPEGWPWSSVHRERRCGMLTAPAPP